MYHKRLILLSILFIFVFHSCQSDRKTISKSSNNEFAKGFELEYHNDFTKLKVFNPWQKAENISYSYYLVDKNIAIPDSLRKEIVIKTPIEKIVCLSTTHIAYLEALDEASSIVGVSGLKYASNKTVRENIERNKVVDVGFGENLNFELIVNQKPDVVLAYGVSSEATNFSDKLRELNIPVIFIAEYLERTPLAKTEWIKAIAPLYQKREVANQFFKNVKDDYLKIKEDAKNFSDEPLVLVGTPFKDTWWTPGGNSYMSNLIDDAGAKYIGKENDSRESYIISFEHAMLWANEADFWINTSSYQSKDELLRADERFSKFSIFEKNKIYNNVKRMNEHGGNDFWESGTIYPNLLLKDLVTIFHLSTHNDSLYYYIKLE